MTHPTLVWLRRDLRLGDQPAFHEALKQGGPVIPLFILSPDMDALGAAAKWRLGESLAALSKDLSSIGSTLILRRGDPAKVLDGLIVETGAKTVIWSPMLRICRCIWGRWAKVSAPSCSGMPELCRMGMSI